MVLASTPDGTDLSTLAEMADKIMEVAAPSGSVAALNTPLSVTHLFLLCLHLPYLLHLQLQLRT